MTLAEALNGDCHSAPVDRSALQRAMQAQGSGWHDMVTERNPHLFADVAVFVSAAQMEQMRGLVEAVERVVKLPGWRQNLPPSSPSGITSDLAALQPSRMAISSIRGDGGERGADPLPNPLPPAGEGTAAAPLAHEKTLGVFFGYDFHLNNDGAHLIEINSNAGGGFLNALLLDSQRETGWPGTPAVPVSPFDSSGDSARTAERLEEAFLDMFRNEWRLARGDAQMRSVAIVDEKPEAQYLYPEFLLAKKMFEREGIAAFIADPSSLRLRGSDLYLDGKKIDLIYNRLTDFSLQRYPALRATYLEDSSVVTPSPSHYDCYADKRNLARLSDPDVLQGLGAKEADIATLKNGVPQTIAVKAGMEEVLWSERKKWFFKPNTGYGSKGAYRGEKLTKRVFAGILASDYVAQKLALPGERNVCVGGAEASPLKYDARCYVYDGQIQLVAARLYQGQTTNFRTPGGGFAAIRVVE